MLNRLVVSDLKGLWDLLAGDALASQTRVEPQRSSVLQKSEKAPGGIMSRFQPGSGVDTV